MKKCEVSIYLAYGMLIYLLGSLYYMIISRNVGTPFNDSLNQTQLIIKKKSSKVRGRIFCEGIIVGFIICILFKPFKKC